MLEGLWKGRRVGIVGAKPASAQTGLGNGIPKRVCSSHFRQCALGAIHRSSPVNAMYKLARSSRPLAAALRAVRVRIAIIFGLSNYRANHSQQETPIRSSGVQQKRNLSIHEYLSANLLRSVRST